MKPERADNTGHLQRASEPSAQSVKLVELSKRTPSVKSLGGSRSDDWNHVLFSQVLFAAGKRNGDSEQQRQHLSEYAYAGLAGIDPQDEIEGMMAAQMISIHTAVMDVMRRSVAPEQTPESRRLYLN